MDLEETNYPQPLLLQPRKVYDNLHLIGKTFTIPEGTLIWSTFLQENIITTRDIQCIINHTEYFHEFHVYVEKIFFNSFYINNDLYELPITRTGIKFFISDYRVLIPIEDKKDS